MELSVNPLVQMRFRNQMSHLGHLQSDDRSTVNR